MDLKDWKNFMTAPLVFIIPVRHQDSVSDWSLLKRYMAETLASVSAQTVPHWECVVVANEHADLPDLPAKCRVRYVDLPLPELPDRGVSLEAYHDAIRADKGLRVYAGIRDVAPDSHVMVVDFDDFVSRNLAELVIRNRAVPGWNVEKGYIWSRGKWCYLQPSFYRLCGTSHIIRRDLFGAFEQAGRPNLSVIKRRLGSHIFIHHDLAEQGHPLSPLPFPGAVYRVGNPQSTSGTGTLFSVMTPPHRFLSHPLSCAGRLSRYRRVTAALRNEFSLPVPLRA